MTWLTNPHALAALRARQAWAQRQAPRRRMGSFPRLAQPDMQRAAYLRRLLNVYVQPLLSHVERHLPALLARLPARRRDAEDTGFEEQLRAMASSFLEATPVAQLEGAARATAEDTSSFQRAQLRAGFQQQLGVDVDALYAEEPGLRAQVDGFVVDNVALIKSVGARHLEAVESLVLEAVAKGSRPEVLARALAERTGITERAAALVASDQVGKFYGALTRTRQERLGVKRYRWRTMRDNRVRHAHEEREGKEYSWDAPPEGGPPGHAVRCRCWGEPLLDDKLADEIESSAGEAEQQATTGWGELGPPREARVAPTRPAWPGRSTRPPRPPARPSRNEALPVGSGAAQVVERHPVLAQALGAALRVDDMHRFDVAENVADLAALPAPLLRHMAPRLAQVHISAQPVTEMGTAEDRRQLRLGDVDASVGGVYIPRTRTVLVAATVPGGGASTSLHEFGHAADFLAGPAPYSTTPEFRAAWESFLQGPYHHSANPYFRQDFPLGAQETFAEAFGYLHKWGEAAARVAFGPEVVAYIRAHFGARAWSEPRP